VRWFNGALTVLSFGECCQALEFNQERVWKAALILVDAPRQKTYHRCG
jgi:hypothetical protein